MQNTLTQNEIRAIRENEGNSPKIISIVPFMGNDMNFYVQENYIGSERYLAVYSDWEQDRWDDKKIENVLDPLPEIRQIIQDHVEDIKQTYVEEDMEELMLIVSLQDAGEKYIDQLRAEFQQKFVAIN